MGSPIIIRDIEDRLKLSGGTLTGSLFINNGYAYATGNADESIFLSRRNFNDEKYSRYISISSKENIAINSAITFVERNNDVWKTYKLYGEHNKPDPPSINAMYSHAGGWDFTKAHSSHLVSFDQSQAVGGPANEPWINGLVSTHGNSLSSYIINAHRSDNWYIGWSEHSTTGSITKNPIWHKLLHDGNYNYFSPTLTGEGASGVWNISITGDANTLDGYHENNFLRYRTAVQSANLSNNDPNTLWHQIGIKQYHALRPDGINDGYDYGSVISMPGENSRFDIWYHHYSTSWKEGIRYRTGWNDDKKEWVKILDSNNYTSFSPTLTGGGASGTWSINITGDAGSLNGKHESVFLRCRGSVSGSGPSSHYDTLWNQIGIKEYFNALPEGLPDSGLYHYGACISFPGSNTRFDLYYNHHTSNHGDGLRYRTGWVDDKQDWAMIYDSKNITCGTGSASIYAEKGIYIKY